jgi:hypothetical protein
MYEVPVGRSGRDRFREEREKPRIGRVRYVKYRGVVRGTSAVGHVLGIETSCQRPSSIIDLRNSADR